MSLYNMLFGTNKLSVPLMQLLQEAGPLDPPRYRDCWLEKERIVIYTRTGGGNRLYYESEEACRANYPDYFEKDGVPADEPPRGPWNDHMRAHPLYVRDQDDSFDTTYAKWYFRFPDQHKEVLEKLAELVTTKQPEERFIEALGAIKSGKMDPK